MQQHQQQLLLAAAEQQKQLQLAQLASTQQRLLGLHSPTYAMYELLTFEMSVIYYYIAFVHNYNTNWYVVDCILEFYTLYS